MSGLGKPLELFSLNQDRRNYDNKTAAFPPVSSVFRVTSVDCDAFKDPELV